MKSIKFLLGIVILLAIVTVFLLINKDDSSIKSGDKDFAIHDQDEISRIEIIVDTIVVSLEKNQNNWKMNDAFPVRKEAISLLLSTLQRIEVSAPVPLELQTVKSRQLKTGSTTVKIWKERKLLKSFYLRYDTFEIDNTIIMMQRSETPFVAKIKGYEFRDLTRIFTTDPDFWRDNTILSIEKDEISEIKITYTNEADQSFRITVLKNESSALYSLTGKIADERIDKNIVKTYLYYFSAIKYRQIKNIVPFETIKEANFAELEITSIGGKKIVLVLYRKPDDEKNHSKSFDLNVCYGTLNNEKTVIEISYFDIDPILRKLDDFIKK